MQLFAAILQILMTGCIHNDRDHYRHRNRRRHKRRHPCIDIQLCLLVCDLATQFSDLLIQVIQLSVGMPRVFGIPPGIGGSVVGTFRQLLILRIVGQPVRVFAVLGGGVLNL